MTESGQTYDDARQFTARSLHHLVGTTENLTQLSLPERTALIEEISRVIPAGNVPSLVAAGLATLKDRAVPVQETRRNLSLLMQGMQTFLDKAVYQAFFAGPAAVLSAYQMILKLTGKDLDQSFPEGTWQFYVEFGVREDSGRHACETIGFQEAIHQENIRLESADELASWLHASAWLLDHYTDLLTNEWLERVKLRLMTSFLGDKRLTERWLKSRPYGVPGRLVEIDFIKHRQQVFKEFCHSELSKVDERLRHEVEAAWEDKKAIMERANELAAYHRQLSILAALTPGDHSDSRSSLTTDQLKIAVIAGGRYYPVALVPPLSPERARLVAAAILRHKPETAPGMLDRALCSSYRREQAGLRKLLSSEAQAELETLRLAPIILNWDSSKSDQPLADIRAARRGIGDHALTIFRCSRSTVFDLSHIFFDGPWGMAVVEILTSQAIQTARNLGTTPKNEQGAGVPTINYLRLDLPAAVKTRTGKVQLAPEVSAETTLVKLATMQQVRRSLQARNDQLNLTINDILILYRSIFGPNYRPSAGLMQELGAVQSSEDASIRQAVQLAWKALEAAREANPAILIPMNASSVSPRERIFPTTFRNPFNELLAQHRKTLETLKAVEPLRGTDRAESSNEFIKAQQLRLEYLATLVAFGQVMARYKDVSMRGESVSTATIKLLAGLPAAVQRMLDSLPRHFDVVNDVIKGQEVFSNVGQVASTSTLVRFNTAKDDNPKKTLAWAVLTDAKGVLHLSLRDFRPHVSALINARQRGLAQRMTQEYLDAYALGLNTFVEELYHIIRVRSHA